MKTKIIKAIVYSLFFVLCFIFFFIRGFPIELVAAQYTGQLEQKLGMKVSYASIDTLFPNGAQLKGIRLVKDSEKEDSVPIKILIDRLSARISLFSLLGGDKNISFSAEFLSGNIEGDFDAGKNEFRSEVFIGELDLGKLGIWPQLFGQELKGKLSAAIKLNLASSMKNVKAHAGDVSIQIQQGAFGNRKIKIDSLLNMFKSPSFQPEEIKQYIPGVEEIAIPWFSLGKTQINLTIKDGKVEIKSLEITSEDLEIGVEGNFQLQPRFEQVTANLQVRVKPSDAKIKEIATQFKGAQKTLQFALDQKKGKDGTYRYHCTGRLVSILAGNGCRPVSP